MSGFSVYVLFLGEGFSDTWLVGYNAKVAYFNLLLASCSGLCQIVFQHSEMTVDMVFFYTTKSMKLVLV